MKIIIFFVFALLSAPLNAADWSGWDGSLGFFSGYRNDRVTTSIDTLNAASQPIEFDHLSAKNISIVELGFQGWGAFLDRWILRGYGSTGFVQGGRYTEDLSGSLTPLTQKNSAHIKNGSSQDASINIGYCYPLSSCLRFGLLVGWSYDTLVFKITNAKENGIPDPFLNNISYRMSWQGPWIGCETFYAINGSLFHLSYELHQANWKASWKLNHGDITTSSFSDTRWGKDSYGQVAYLDLFYPIACQWNVGIKVCYQYWIAKNGKAKPINEDVSLIGTPPGQVDRVRRATWSSIGGQLAVNYEF